MNVIYTLHDTTKSHHDNQCVGRVLSYGVMGVNVHPASSRHTDVTTVVIRMTYVQPVWTVERTLGGEITDYVNPVKMNYYHYGNDDKKKHVVTTIDCVVSLDHSHRLVLHTDAL